MSSGSCSIFKTEVFAVSRDLDIKLNNVNKATVLYYSLSILNSIKNIYQPNIWSRKVQNQI